MKSQRTAWVADSYAFLALLQGEKGAAEVEALLSRAESGEVTLHVSVINAAEVYYRFCKLDRSEAAERFWTDLHRQVFPVQVESATDRRVVEAARIKGRFPISFADAFAIALAIEKDAVVITGDPEFRAVEAAKLVRVKWI